jgi:hypothetical protein
MSEDVARDIAVRALTFVTGDEVVLQRFLRLTGWTPGSITTPGSESAMLLASLDYLMGEEDLLLTFAANSGIDPTDISKAHRALSKKLN